MESSRGWCGRKTGTACKCVVELRKLISKKPTSFPSPISTCGLSAVGNAPLEDPESSSHWSTYMSRWGPSTRVHCTHAR